MDGQTPKKQRKEGTASLSPVGTTPSPAGAQAPQGPSQVAQWAVGPPNEAAGDNVRTVGRSGATVTDAAKAFRELRVRAPRASSPRRDGGHGGTAQRPPSPKKRKASFNIDKEFILKDDKVKRNTDTQGDISQARGQLGQLLFEFSQIELNRDLLEAIKRTESKTGRSSGRPIAPRSRLDRSAFEVAVTDAAELLQAQLGSVEAHSEDAALRGAILRTYAVQAIAAFADEDSDSEESDAGGEGAAGSSSDDENADSNSRRRMQGASSSQDDQAAGPRGQHQQEAGSHSQDTLPRAASAAGCHSPPHLPPHLQQQQPGRPPGAAFASPPRLQPAGSGAGPAGSSSYLPDAPPDSALEDTATAGGPRRHQDPGREGGAAPPFPGPAGNRFAWPSLQQQEQQQQSERGGDDGALQRMRMLSLEAEGSAQQGQSAGDADEDGPQDMIRSPAPVTSRPMAPRLPPLPMGDSQSLLEIRASQQQEQAPQGRAGHGSGGGTRRTAAAAAGARMAAVFEEAANLAVTGRPEQQQQQQQQGQQAQEQEQESSEGHSTGQASSAAHEAPKRQRRSGDLLPPLFEHSSRQQQHQQQQQQPDQRTASGGAPDTDQAAAADREISSRAAAAARRAAILGSLRPRERAEHPGPQQQRAQDLVPEGPQQGEGPDVDGRGTGAGRAAHPDRQQQPPPLQEQQDGQQHEDEAEGGPPGEPSDAALRGPRAAHSGSSVWGSTLVCADLTVNDVASQYWPFLRSAMRGQTATLQAGDKALVASLVAMLGETISDTYVAVSGSGRRPPAEVKSLVAATAFDDFFRAQNGGAESSGASLG